ncbi:hypothetical protein Pst134EA_013006 [Puccinia striiformis f. sp. tritici]|uniref:Hydrophobin n=2 Tax=Puccinia striiformis TaxID=27350 RepID=A0A0L0VIZ7_9BASI|nr:hypothetical protein Pst134EA_013006 [Puccinia striiformis f. sp. tritici]KAH9465110.1 hypothetical protein Pst134EA_013006 [Puccinia striiformis f. sp. tritici]KAI9622031.1 hypothetical protein H4Q26_015469 [Puccinia striiformis f. sp. tritici PST-130]KNE99267.1 hypothetical protein PSTG_07381 [Puccinia striiformis f. sp. tritici PST-78]POW17420.1 hypothetical protein PSHT_06419 [Puccinia striiformis]
MVSNIITRLLVLIAGFATNYVSAYFCTMPTFNQAACMKINYSTGGLQGGGSKPGAPNRNDKFGCADGNVNTPLCCSLPFKEVTEANVGQVCVFAPQGPK